MVINLKLKLKSLFLSDLLNNNLNNIESFIEDNNIEETIIFVAETIN